MRAVFFLLNALFLCIPCQSADVPAKCPNTYEGLEVDAQLQAAVLQHDEPISLVLTLHNTGTHPVRLRSYMEPTWYWINFEVIGPAGQKIPYTGPEYKIIDDGNRRLTLEPGYFWGRRIDDLRNFYDLTKLGHYRIRAIYGISPGGQCKHLRIISAPISFEIT